MNSLILDVKITIASAIDWRYFDYPLKVRDEDRKKKVIFERMSDSVWYKLMTIDDVFNEYAWSKDSIAHFIKVYRRDIVGDIRATFLFGKLHSFDGDAALDLSNDDVRQIAWARYGLLQRDDDFPSFIDSGNNYERYIFAKNGMRTKITTWRNEGTFTDSDDIPLFCDFNGIVLQIKCLDKAKLRRLVLPMIDRLEDTI